MYLSLFKFSSLLFLLLGCMNEVEMSRVNPLTSGGSSSNNAITLTPSSATIVAGQAFSVVASNGVAPYFGSANGVGTFSDPTLEYTSAVSQVPLIHNVTIMDQLGLTANLQLEILGFQSDGILEIPKGYGDQNYGMLLGQTLNGDLYASTVAIEGAGWEAWVTYKSTDLSLTWTEVDRYLMFTEGESHPMDIATKGNDIYICGYVWGTGVTPSPANSEWLIRKSTDGGASWSNIDYYYRVSGNNVCHSIAVNPNNGDIYAGGYSLTDGKIRMSDDDGVTWTEIAEFTGLGAAKLVRTSPNGTIWALVGNNLYKGSFAGTWTWDGPYAVSATALQVVGYQQSGEFFFLSDTTAFYIGRTSNAWIIRRTTDAGVTWTTVYTGAASTEGMSMTQAQNGDLVAVGSTVSSPNTLRVLKSTDLGLNWSESFSAGGVATSRLEGLYVLKSNTVDEDLVLLGANYNDYQSFSYTSADDGDNWVRTGDLIFYDYLYSQVEGYAEDSSGNIYVTGWVYKTDPTIKREAFIVSKSTDQGQSWSQADTYFDPTGDASSERVKVAPNGDIFATGFSSTDGFIIRKSADNGVSWSTVETNAGTSFGPKPIAIDSNNDVYYFDGNLTPATLRKGISGGTVYSDRATFPLVPGPTNFRPTSLEAYDDGSVWVGARMDVGAGVFRSVIYRSSDGGGTWVEKLNVVSTVANVYLSRAPNGSMYTVINGDVYRSTDEGDNWTQIYFKEFGNAQNVVAATNDRPFIKVGNNVYYLADFSASWTQALDLTDRVSPMAAESGLNDIYQCQVSPLGVCLNVTDGNLQQGSIQGYWPLKSP